MVNYTTPKLEARWPPLRDTLSMMRARSSCSIWATSGNGRSVVTGTGRLQLFRQTRGTVGRLNGKVYLAQLQAGH